MHFTELEITNVLKLRTINVVFDENKHLTIIGGNNEQGKTSFLKSMKFAMGGAKHTDDMPVRQGQEKARILLKTDQFTVEWRCTKNGKPGIVMLDLEGQPYEGPQGVLNSLRNALSFDPFGFSDKKPADQVKDMLVLLKLEDAFAEIQNVRKESFDKRTDQKRDKKLLEARIEPKGEPATFVDVTGLSKKLGDAHGVNSDRRESLTNEQTLKEKVSSLKNLIEKKKMEIRLAEEAIDEIDVDIEKTEGMIDAAITCRKAAVDTDALQLELDQAAETNKRFEHNKTQHLRAEEVKVLDLAIAESENVMELCDQKWAEQLEASDLPVDGLKVAVDGVTLNGIPFAQCSSEERMRVGFMICTKMNPSLKVILIEHGSLFDDERLAHIAKLAEEHDMYVFMERVGNGNEVDIVIDDGLVVENRIGDTKPKKVEAKLGPESEESAVVEELQYEDEDGSVGEMPHDTY